MANSSFTVAGQAAVSSVGTGTGLQGGPITSAGTINLSTQMAMCYRLTLTSNTPVTTTDVSAATTLYLTPYVGKDIDLYTGSVWQRFQPGQLSITNAGLSASTLYDVFVDYNGGTPQLALTAWSNNSTRATALTYQDGVYVLSGTSTKRYAGTIATDGSSQFNDTSLIRGVWNYYNRLLRPISSVLGNGTNWTYNSSAWRTLNGSNIVISTICGVIEDNIMISFGLNAGSGNTSGYNVGIGLNTTSAPYTGSVNIGSSNNTNLNAYYSCYNTFPPSIGYVYYAPIESVTSPGTVTAYAVVTGMTNTLVGWIKG